MAGLAAAWRLSDPEGEQPEVTVYQRGWRLGGKGASSRGPNGRIEEHGLHVWLGFYDNAFRLAPLLLRGARSPAHRPRLPDPGLARRVRPGKRDRARAHRRDRFAVLARPVSRERSVAGRGTRHRRAHLGRFPGTRPRAAGTLRRVAGSSLDTGSARGADLIVESPGTRSARCHIGRRAAARGADRASRSGAVAGWPRAAPRSFSSSL